MSLLSILLVIFVICLILWATQTLTSAFGVGQPVAGIILVVVVLVLVFWGAAHLGIVLPL